MTTHGVRSEVGQLRKVLLFEPSQSGSSILHAAPGGIYEISLDSDDWLAAACSLVTRPLTAAELEAVTPGRESLEPCGTVRTAGT